MSDKENAVQQAQGWAQEARTQRATVLSILRYFGLPERDYEALALIKAKYGETPPDGVRVDAPRRLSDPEARAEVDALVRDITSSPEKAREFLKQCGILTADGRRSPNFYPDDPDGVEGRKP